MHVTGIVQVLFLLLVAHGTPILARNLLGDRYNQPVDFGRLGPDGRPLLGPTKTIRGLLAAAVMTGLVAPLVGMSVGAGALFGLCAMLGDLGSSCIKRRLGVKSSESVLGLDQGLEALCPVLVFHRQFALGIIDIAIAILAFFVLEIILSRLLYWLHIRNRPL